MRIIVLVALAAAMALSAAWAASVSSTLTIGIASGQPLLGLYQGQGTSPAFHTWAGRYPDYVINLSFLGPGGGSDPSGNSPNPVVLDFDTIGTSVCTSFATAASGGCDSNYHNTMDSLIIPY